MTQDPNPFDQIKAKHIELERVGLTPQEERAWLETRTAMQWSTPCFTSLLYSMMSDDQDRHAFFTEDKRVPVAATDDRRMFINPKTFFDDKKYNLLNRMFIGAHEILHAALNHCGQLHMHKARGYVQYPDGSRLPYDGDAMNIAQDFVINALLVESDIGALPDGALYDLKLAKPTDSVIDAYRKVYKEMEKGKGKGGEDPGKGRFDNHLEPGTGDGESPQEAADKRDEGAWGQAIAIAAQAARVQGKLPAGLDRFFKELLEPKVDWREKLRTVVSRSLGSSATSWSTLDPQLVVRKIGAPGRVGFGAGRIIVGVDTSGSITQGMMDQFMGEVAGIMDDARPRELWLMQCDAEVQELSRCDDSSDLKVKKIKGGGGTDFRPVFDRIAEEFDNECDFLIYLTDGYGSFPQAAPSYPVIWGNISTGGYRPTYPFGEVVDLPFKDT